MTLRIFKKVLLDFKFNNNIELKYSDFMHYTSKAFSVPVYNALFSTNKILVGYSTNKRNFSSIQGASSHSQQIHRNVFIGPLLCSNNKPLIKGIRVNYYPVSINNVKQYSSSSPIIVNEALKYNTGIFEVISESICVRWATEAFRLMHDQVDLPWWASIMVIAIISRIVVHIPFSVIDHQSRARRENLKDEITNIAKKIKMEVDKEIATSHIPPLRAQLLFTQALSKEQKKLFQRENCHPFKSVAILLLQAPIWLSFSFAIRNMCYMLPEMNAATMKDYNELTNGGFGWIQNLIEIDHYFVLPILFALSSLITMEINKLLFNVKQTRFSKVYTNVWRLILVCFIPLTGCAPSGLCLYWVTNNFCAVSQSLLFLSPKFRRLVRIPKCDFEVPYPYAELHNRFIGRFFFKRSVT